MKLPPAIAAAGVFLVAGCARSTPEPRPASAAMAKPIPSAVEVAAVDAGTSPSTDRGPIAGATSPDAGTPECIVPRALVRVADGSHELDAETFEDALGGQGLPEDETAPPRPDGLAVRLLPDVVQRGDRPMLVAVVEQGGKRIRALETPAPAGGSVGVTLSMTAKYLVWTYSRSGPLLQPVSGGPTVLLPWGSILSPDDTYVLEPAYAHGFTSRLEHGRDVIKLDLATGKKKVISSVSPSAVRTPPNDEGALNSQTAVAIGPTGCVYATTQPGELAVHRARDDAKLAVAEKPGPAMRLRFSRSGRYLLLDPNDAPPRAYRLQP